MDGGPAVRVFEVPGIDLEYRPRGYFWATDLNIALPSDVAGEVRRQVIRRFVEAGSPVPYGFDAPVLNDAICAAWGRLHPSHMGGEYLPPLRDKEVEIARISLESVTADQISIRARRVGRRIEYCVVDEYPETSTYVCRPTDSPSPLSLRELVVLMETASEGGSIVRPILALNAQNSAASAELASFVTVSSDFYAELGPYYRALTDAWLEGCARGKR